MLGVEYEFGETKELLMAPKANEEWLMRRGYSAGSKGHLVSPPPKARRPDKPVPACVSSTRSTRWCYQRPRGR